MKKIRLYIIGIIAVAISSCMKDDRVTFTDTVFEWDAGINARAAGVDYPILTRVPAYNKVVTNADPLITRTSGTIKFRINLVGPQRSTPTTVTYQALQLTPNTATPLIQPAVAGTHYTITGSCVVPANSSFGEAEVAILNPGVSSTISRDIVLEILSTSDVKPSENYKRLGIRIAEN
ncbi:hypothetical protein [Mucilaginibacter sp. CSA2-8R]|uniref:hypothetical protein n=1 Tax=Mucilaginibacter sp. CSA2-8R TaxID=3141542 RepID=UPI00315DC32E